MTKSLFASICLAAQGLFFVGFGFLLADLASLVNIITPEMEQDSTLLTPYIAETFKSYLPLLGVGIIGAVTDFILLSKVKYWASWFLKESRVIGWLWLLFVPIGTIIGVVLLGARREAIKTLAAT